MLDLTTSGAKGAPLTMTSREIAELTGKELSHVHRDIRSMLVDLYGQEHVDKIIPDHRRGRRAEFVRENAESILLAIVEDDPRWDHQDWRGFAWDRDARGYTTEFRLDHSHTMTLVAGYNTKLRKAIIDRWQELESSVPRPAPVTINVRDQAQLVTIAMQLIEVNQEQQAKIDQQQRKIESDAPMVLGFERIAKSDGSMCVTDAAKTLQMQPRRLFQLLQERGWLYRRPMGSGWLAYQDRIQQGYLEHKVTTGERSSDGHEWSNTQVRVTPKGLARLAVILSQMGGGQVAASG